MEIPIAYIDESLIKIVRDSSRRAEIDASDLVDSISRKGLLHPIVVNRVGDEYQLVAGERRLTAMRQLEIKTIPCHLKENLNEVQIRGIALEENIKRQDVPWQERCAAIYDLHKMYAQEAGEDFDEFSLASTAERIGVQRDTVYKAVTAYAEMLKGNEKIANAPTRNAALNIIKRDRDRAVASVLNDLLTPEVEIHDLPEGSVVTLPQPSILPASVSILNEDFHTWAGAYAGKPFNFIHCDFPYGVNLHRSRQTTLDSGQETYSDTPADFAKCVRTLIDNQDRLIAQDASIMFWFDMDQYELTRKLLADLDFKLYNIPLIWHKSDNSGVLSDANRRARHIYEACFYGHKGEMKNVQAVSDLYSAPTSKEHTSSKPEPMLRNFMRMFVDKYTRILDPTCGSASSLRAAESLDAEYVLGLETNPTFAESAIVNLQIFRNKRALEKTRAQV